MLGDKTILTLICHLDANGLQKQSSQGRRRLLNTVELDSQDKSPFNVRLKDCCSSSHILQNVLWSRGLTEPHEATIILTLAFLNDDRGLGRAAIDFVTVAALYNCKNGE